MSEKAFENKVKKYIESKGGWVVKYFANAFTKSGIPDLLVCYKGKFIALEMKTDKGKVSDLQRYHINQVIHSGGYARTLRPSEWKQFKEWFDKI